MDFTHIMKNLPVPVLDSDIEEMFTFADSDGDGRLSFKEFEVMVLPQEPPAVTKPHITDIGMMPQVFSPPSPSSCPPPSNYASPLLPRPDLSASRSSLASQSTPQRHQGSGVAWFGLSRWTIVTLRLLADGQDGLGQVVSLRPPPTRGPGVNNAYFTSSHISHLSRSYQSHNKHLLQ